MEVWKNNGRELCNIADSMWAILGAIAADPTAGDIVCVIDALDECDDVLRNYFVRKLTRLVSGKTQCHVRFVVTSRPYHEIQDIFGELQIDSKSSFLRILGEEESEAISNDIEMVIEHKVFRLSKLNDSAKQSLISRLRKMENKTYLWLYLIWGTIATEASITGRQENLFKVLDKLPDSVGDAYEAILNKSPDRSRTEKLLHIVVGAERPLTTEEINVVMHINVDYTGTQAFRHIPLEDADAYPAILRSLCGLFIRIEGGKVYLIHQTAKEFLVETQSEKRKENFWKHCLQPGTSHRILAEACISYLFLDDFDNDVNKSYWFMICLESIRANRLGCFLDYSASLWTVHYQCAAPFVVPAAVVDFCSPSNRRSFWLHMNTIQPDIDDTANTLKLLLSKMETLPCEFVKTHLAEYASLSSDKVEIVGLILNHPRHPGPILDGKQSPVVFAALNANMKCMELLMNEPHDINKCKAVVTNWDKIDKARRFAVEQRRLAVKQETFTLRNGMLSVDRLRAEDSNSDSDSDLNENENEFSHLIDVEIDALSGGIISANEKIVERLIIDGADINMITELGTPLFVAAALSSKTVVQQLIDKGAQITSFDDEGIEQPSPLVIAAARGDIEIVKVLLKAGARIDEGFAIAHSIIACKGVIKPGFYPSAIEAAKMGRHRRMVRFLQEYKAKNGTAEMEGVGNVMKPGKI
ncbi:68ffa22f-365d-404d-aa21-12ceb35b2acf [Sclerotinia trifoliorum]|uniref:68ffa22f-365d-404d-aa21-12ceb35b2acf n=1 Tax=Sclerotinia trifoliorum TaxID=28548 RepID=A0A8H2ZWW7_9HELO|nr:68ffa22f-365d-404d-aa21-12ceb35b2acf [Sclerotinia trifoliorum]